MDIDMILEGDLVILRPIEEEDTDIIVQWRNSEAVMKRYIDQNPLTKEVHLNWFHNMVQTGKVVQMLIIHKETKKPIGTAFFKDFDTHHQKAEYGLFIGEEEGRGNGLGVEVTNLMLKYAFSSLGLNRVIGRILADNIPSLRSQEKAGFRRDGYLREDVCINGKFKDVVLVSALKRDPL